MHSFSADHLIVFDPFGLTRITWPGKVKHNKKVNGEFLVHNGSLLVGHSQTSNRRFAMTVPELKVLSVETWNYNLKYGEAMAVTANGLPFEISDGHLVVYGTDGKQRSKVKLAKGKALPRIDLGPDLAAAGTQWNTHVTMGADGTFVAFTDEGVFGGKLATGKTAAISDAWSAPAGKPQGRLHMRAGTFGAFVSTFHAAQGKAMCALIAGGKVTRAAVDCIGPVDFDGTRIAYQTSISEVCRRPIGSGEVERFELPKRAVGLGHVMADSDRLLFLSPDHERVHDLVNDDVVERGLPAAERETRAKLFAFVDKFRAPANAANLSFRLAALCPPAYGYGPRPQWVWDEGDQSALRLCVLGNLLEQARSDSALQAGSHSLPQYLAPVTEVAMQRMFELIDEYGFDLRAALSMFESVLESHWDPRSDGKKRKPLFDKRAAQMLLWAIAETLRAKKQPRLADKAKKWAAQPLTPRTLIDKIDPAKDWCGERFSDPQTGAAWLVLDYLEDRAGDVLRNWLVDRPSPMVDGNMHIVGKPAAAMIVAFPKAKKAFLDVLKKTADGKNEKLAEQARSLQSTIDFNMP